MKLLFSTSVYFFGKGPISRRKIYLQDGSHNLLLEDEFVFFKRPDNSLLLNKQYLTTTCGDVPKISSHFPKISKNLPNLSEGQTNVLGHFPKISEYFPKIIADHTQKNNIRVAKADMLCEDVKSLLSISYHLVYHEVLCKKYSICVS